MKTNQQTNKKQKSKKQYKTKQNKKPNKWKGIQKDTGSRICVLRIILVACKCTNVHVY